MPVPTVNYAKRGTNPWRLEAIRKYAGSSILDVGCGSGAYVLDLAKEYDISGVDYQAFESWQESPDKFAISDAAELDQSENSVDTITSFEALEHLREPDKALKEYYRVCRKNVILTVPNCDITAGMSKSNMLYGHWLDSTHVNFFDIDSISALVETAGFKVSHRYHINEINLMPLMFELFGVSPKLPNKVFKLISKFKRHRYYITCLVVGDKQ